MKIKIDKFVIAVFIAIIIAYFLPQWGVKESKIPLAAISSIGVSLIFFFYGLKLSADKLIAGLKNWKLHVLIQVSTFLLFPLLVLPFYPLAVATKQEVLWLSMLFLAALPSTVSSSVVMVSMAKGNLPAAIFNASISGIIGIAITPLWMGMFLEQTSGDFNLGAVYLQLIVEIILPVLAGILLQRYWGKFAVQYSKQLTLFDKTVILIIIYKSFAQSFADGLFAEISLRDLIQLSGLTVLLFYSMYYLVGYLAKYLKFNVEDNITAQFCGTKKSLVHGTVFSKILFSGMPTIGVLLLPLMIFHAFQLVVISYVAGKLANRLT